MTGRRLGRVEGLVTYRFEECRWAVGGQWARNLIVLPTPISAVCHLGKGPNLVKSRHDKRKWSI